MTKEPLDHNIFIKDFFVPDPLVSIILTHHLAENKDYLELCLEGVKNSSYGNYRCYVVSSTPSPSDEDIIPEDERFTYLWRPNANMAWKKHKEILNTLPHDTEYILFLSDDVVMNTSFLYNMVSSFKGREIIMNPMSNSDMGSLYEAQMVLDGGPLVNDIELKPDMMMEDFKDFRYRIPFIQPKADILMWVPPMSLSFYCTMMNKSVFDKVGYLDPQLEYRHNDQDYCLRAARLGIRTAINFGAFAFHFGSRTLRKVSDYEKDKCTQHFKKKWGFS